MIKATDINYQVKNHRILQQINLTITSGEFIAIVGPNGAGKSTLLALLAHELQTNENKKISFKNKNLPDWEATTLSMHKAKFSQQYASDIPLLVKEVVLMGRYPYFHTKPKELDLEKVAEVMLYGDIAHLKDRDYNTLSGGEKQRVHLARVLVQLENEIQNKIIFLDEPLNNLDIKHQHSTLSQIKKFVTKDNAAVVVLHDLNLASEFADRIIMMKNGSIFSDGSPENVLQPNTISEVYNFPCIVCKNPVKQRPLIVFG